MEITATSVLYGSNIYADSGVIRHLIALNAEENEQDIQIDVTKLAKLKEFLPDLKTSCCESSITANHLLEHICVELQNISGARVNFDCFQTRNTASNQTAVYPYEDENIGLKCADLALDLINDVLVNSTSMDHSESQFDFKQRLDEFLDFAASTSIRVQDRAVLDEAMSRNIPVIRRADRLFQIGYGKLQQKLSATKTSHTNVISNDIAANKDYSRRILSELGLPVPKYRRVRNAREAAEAAEQIGFPVVVKPNNGGMGRGVSIGLKNAKAVREAYKLARQWGRSILVEQFVPGSDFRMLVINGQLIAASNRVPAHVRGDGKHTIQELVDKTNSDPRRGPGQELPWTHLQLDKKADLLLAELGYNHQSIPDVDEIVYLRLNANTSDGGTAADITDIVHPDNRDIAVRAVEAIGLDIAGVDLLTTDISKSMWKTNGTICEINSRPGIRKHMWPAEGKPRNVTGPLIDMLFPKGSNGRIPIIAIAGAGNTRNCANKLAHMLSLGGYTVGLSTQNGLTVGDYRHRDIKTNGLAATRRILLDPTVDIAVLEINPADTIRKGLGFDSCDVCAIMHPEPDAGITDTSQTRLWNEAIKVVSNATKGKFVFTSSDGTSRIVIKGRQPQKRNVSLKATDSMYLDATGRENITIEDSSGKSIHLPVKSVLSKSMNNRSGVQDTLFAIALATSVGIKPDIILQGLSSFDSLDT